MKRIPKVLVLDDDLDWLSQVPLVLEDDYEVYALSNIDQGISAIEKTIFDVVLLDINFGNDPRSGIDMFRMIKAKDHGVDVIVISGETQPERLIQIMNAGITKFLAKPCTPDQVRVAVRNCIQVKEYKLRALNLLQSNSPYSQLIGRSSAMQRLREEIDFVKRAEIKDILLTGETGTGKEVVAKSIAYQSDPNFRFCPIHCGAISDGLAESELFGHVKGAFTGADRDKPSVFEIVGGGFVYFDEIGDMPFSHQSKLLRVIQERQVQRVGSSDIKDVSFRSISATHVDLQKAILQKSFREDLYYRIAKAVIHVPSLRDRKEDIPELVHHFIISSFANRNITITEEAMDLLIVHDWPGNVRQLKATIESICSRNMDGIIRESDVCHALPQVAKYLGNKTTKGITGRYGYTLINQEREKLEKAILQANGNRGIAAKQLGVSRATFYRKCNEFGII